jgi:ABC-type lipoprotein export system ATPase subunit
VWDFLTAGAAWAGAALLVATHDARAKARFDRRWELCA